MFTFSRSKSKVEEELGVGDVAAAGLSPRRQSEEPRAVWQPSVGALAPGERGCRAPLRAPGRRGAGGYGGAKGRALRAQSAEPWEWQPWEAG